MLALILLDGGRHGRAPVPGRGPGQCAEGRRRARRAGHGPARQRLCGLVPGRGDHRDPVRDAVRTLRAADGAGGMAAGQGHAQGDPDDPAAQARCRRRLRRLPDGSPGVAATLLGVPTAIHEANGVLGRANRLLARRASLIATGFEATQGHRRGCAGPDRPHRQSRPPDGPPGGRDPLSAPEPDGPIRILAFGGSQGARVMSDIVPSAIQMLPDAMRSRVTICQQAREEDLERVRAHYRGLRVAGARSSRSSRTCRSGSPMPIW